MIKNLLLFISFCALCNGLMLVVSYLTPNANELKTPSLRMAINNLFNTLERDGEYEADSIACMYSEESEAATCQGRVFREDGTKFEFVYMCLAGKEKFCNLKLFAPNLSGDGKKNSLLEANRE